MAALASSFALAALLALQADAPRKAAPQPLAFPYEIAPRDALWGHLSEGNFREPVGVFYEPTARELYVADSKNGLIGIFGDDGAPLFAFGGATLLVEPRSVLALADGTICVVDVARTDVRVFSYRGEPQQPLVFPRPLELEPGAAPQPVRVCALARDAQGLWYVGDQDDNCVRVYDAELHPLRTLAPPKGSPAIGALIDIAVSADGLVAVADQRGVAVLDSRGVPRRDQTGVPSLFVFDAAGSLIAAFGGRDIALSDFTSPAAVAFDELGYLYAVDMLRHDVKVYTPAGKFLARFGGWMSPETRGHAPGELLYPVDIATAPGGRLFIAERFGQRVQVFERRPLAAKSAAPAASEEKQR